MPHCNQVTAACMHKCETVGKELSMKTKHKCTRCRGDLFIFTSSKVNMLLTGSVQTLQLKFLNDAAAALL
jgi:hypothetical protein